MKPSRFDYLAARSEEAISNAKQSYGDDAVVLAGGLSLMPMLNMRVVTPRVVVDINRVEALEFITTTIESITVGALCTQAALAADPAANARLPMLREVIAAIGHYQTRERGTVCGSLAHADPSAEIPLLASVLEATIELVSVGGSRHVPANEFLCGVLETDCADEEWIRSVSFPVRPTSAWFFEEFSTRRGDFALAACLGVRVGSDLRIGLAGVAETPVVFELGGQELERSADSRDLAHALIDTVDFSMFSNDAGHYRLQASRHLIERAMIVMAQGET